MKLILILSAFLYSNISLAQLPPPRSLPPLPPDNLPINSGGSIMFPPNIPIGGSPVLNNQEFEQSGRAKQKYIMQKMKSKKELIAEQVAIQNCLNQGAQVDCSPTLMDPHEKGEVNDKEKIKGKKYGKK